MSEVRVLTVDEAARVLRVGRSSVYRAIARGDLPSIRVGRSVRVPVHRLREILGEEGQGPSGAES
jgi:excisionase family DNA binding protein